MNYTHNTPLPIVIIININLDMKRCNVSVLNSYDQIFYTSLLPPTNLYKYY